MPPIILAAVLCLTGVLHAVIPELTDYERRLAALEAALRDMRTEQRALSQRTQPLQAASVFNPEIGMILQGFYFNSGVHDGTISGFGLSEHAEKPHNGFSLDHTELTMSAIVDPRFLGSATLALESHDGHTELELETAFIQTIPNDFIADGLTLTIGRAFWEIGYLNEHHLHTDDFSDRPLPYRVFLDMAYNDDGVQANYILPTKQYIALLGGLFNGSDGPFATEEGPAVWSAGVRIGGDYSPNTSWRLGASSLSGRATDRLTGDLSFTGDVALYILDWRSVWVFRGQEFSIQSEYLYSRESGMYTADTPVAVDRVSQGWYAQAVYRFQPQWRIGCRYSQLMPDEIPDALAGTVLNADGHQPREMSVMLAWSGSEYSRIRLQYTQAYTSPGVVDGQVSLQYSMSLGAHRVHTY